MSTIAELSAQLESIWADLDEVLSRVEGPAWTNKHGRHWTFRDVPYHLSYFDEEIIAEPIERGADVPEGEQQILATIAELNAWNDAHLANRPLDKSPQELIAAMHEARQGIRDAIAPLGDANLGDPVLLRLPGTGWSDVDSALRLAQVHAWNHFVEAKLRLGLAGPGADPGIAHTALHSLVSSMPIVLNRAAATDPFVAQIGVEGPGGGNWTIDVRDGGCTVVEGAAQRPDLMMRYRDAETFAAAAFKVKHPMLLMLSRRLRVKGMSQMGRFAKLFPTSPPD
jgi:hypothetical protein